MDCNKIDRLNENLTLLDYTREKTKHKKKCCCKVVRSLPASVRCTSSFSTVKSCNPFKSEKKFVGNIGKLEFLLSCCVAIIVEAAKVKKKWKGKIVRGGMKLKFMIFPSRTFLEQQLGVFNCESSKNIVQIKKHKITVNLFMTNCIRYWQMQWNIFLTRNFASSHTKQKIFGSFIFNTPADHHRKLFIVVSTHSLCPHLEF